MVTLFDKHFFQGSAFAVMVCVPCILLPFLLALYLKFIQPIIFRLLPEAWKTRFDAILYPTCPARIPAQPSAPPPEDFTDIVEGELCECGPDSKKEQ